MFLAVSMNVSPLLMLEPPTVKSCVSALRRLAAKAKLDRVRVDGFKEEIDDDFALEIAAFLAPPLADFDELLGGVENGFDLASAQFFQTEQVAARPQDGFVFRHGHLHCHGRSPSCKHVSVSSPIAAKQPGASVR